LIINIGHDAVEKPPFVMEPEESRKVIHVNFNSAKVDDVYFPHLEIVGDIASSMDRLTEKVDSSAQHDFSFYQRMIDFVNGHLSDRSDSNDFPIRPQRLVADIQQVMGPDDIVALDNGMYKIWFARNYKAAKPNKFLVDNALATMGAGLPSAMEAARLNPDRKVLAVCGDGGFMMNNQELETAARMGLDLVVLVLKDDGYGMIQWKQVAQGHQPFALNFNNPDFVANAESFHVSGHRITQTDQLVTTLNDCFKQGGVHVVELPIDYADNLAVLVDELKQKVCLI
jgi:acetolactate synthase-1/2/3 large subunit